MKYDSSLSKSLLKKRFSNVFYLIKFLIIYDIRKRCYCIAFKNFFKKNLKLISLSFFFSVIGMLA